MYQLLCSDLLSTFGYGQILPLLSLSLLRRGLSLPEIALGTSLLLLTCFACSLPAGLFADLYGHKQALLCGALLQAVAAWGQITATTPSALYASSLLSGLSLALFSGAKVPMLSRIIPGAKLGSAIAACRAIAGLGTVLGSAVAALISWRNPKAGGALWLGATTINLALIPLLWLPSGQSGVSLRLVQRPHWRSRPLLRLMATVFLAAIGYSLLTPYISLLLDGRGFSLGLISASFSAWQLVALAAWPLALWLDRLHQRSLPPVLLFLASLTLLLACPLPQACWWGLWLLWQVALNLVQCLLQSALARVTRRAISFSGLAMLQTVAAIIGAQGGSRLLSRPSWLYVIAAGCCLGAYAILPRALPRKVDWR